MAQVAAAPRGDDQDSHRNHPHPLPQPLPHAKPAPRGTKRAADGGLENEQRLSKRFDLLNLDNSSGNGTRLYIPVAGPSDVTAPPPKPSPRPLDPTPVHTSPSRPRPRPPPADDYMQVEDTPNRVYIHDLATELSDIESDEEKPIFLSDIEKHLAKIPKHVLAAPELRPTKDNQLILYSVPSSLTILEEQDKVRRAIKEVRARVREKQANPIGEPATDYNLIHPNAGLAAGTNNLEEDEDTMDLD